MNPRYLETARLMTQIAPHIFAGGHFALKGGTAINLFYRNMPRLSVDLDLVFIDHSMPRGEALAKIAADLDRATDRLRRQGFTVQATGKDPEPKILVSRQRTVVKIEVNTVMRGTVEPVENIALVDAARDTLLADLELPVVSLADVYGGKLVAALDRQHPRDLFDVIQLLEHEGITPAIRRAFVIYLAAHNRPPHEVLYGRFKDLRPAYVSDFEGMTAEPVPLDKLVAARERLAQTLRNDLDQRERAFLLSVVRNRTDCALLGVDHLEAMPGLQWKLHNLAKLERSNPKKFRDQSDLLEKCLDSNASGKS